LVQRRRVEYSGDKACAAAGFFVRCPRTSRTSLFTFEFVSGDGSNEALLGRRTGKIYWRSPLSGLDEIEDELPDGIEDDENYIVIPHKRELGLGKPLVLDLRANFCRKISTTSELCSASVEPTRSFARC
jgi:hypothetical protein